MDDDLLKKISKDGNLHPSNKVMDILRKVVCVTKEEDARICEGKKEKAFNEYERWFNIGCAECAEAIRASK